MKSYIPPPLFDLLSQGSLPLHESMLMVADLWNGRTWEWSGLSFTFDDNIISLARLISSTTDLQILIFPTGAQILLVSLQANQLTSLSNSWEILP